MISNHKMSACTRRRIVASALCLGVGATILSGLPAYADTVPPKEAAALAIKTADAVDPGFSSIEQPAPPTSAIKDAETVVTGPVTSAGTPVVMGTRELWLTGPGTGATPNAVSPSVDVLSGQGATTTVVQRAENRVRLMIVIPDANAPSEYSFGVSGGSYYLEKDGSVTVKDAAGETIGAVDTPWALDKTGRSLPTSYSVADGRLVQHVDHRGATYPVVADPKVSLGWYIYVRYSKTEVQSLGTKVGALGYKYALPGMCAIIPYVSAAIACGTVLGVYGNSIGDTILSARSKKQCFELRFNYTPVVIVGWRGYNC